MPRQEFWNRHRGRERSWDVRDLREDYGQADYSRDYGFDRRRRVGYRTEARGAGRDDFGQADFSRDYDYDPKSRTAVRRGEMDERNWRSENAAELDREHRYEPRRERRLDDPRTWFGGGRDRYEARHDRYDVRDRRGRYDPDEEIWREVCDRLADDRRLDARDIVVDVRDGEVTLRGVVDDRDQKRRAEDLADIEGVVDVHNHLTIRTRGASERGSAWRRGFGL